MEATVPPDGVKLSVSAVEIDEPLVVKSGVSRSRTRALMATVVLIALAIPAAVVGAYFALAPTSSDTTTNKSTRCSRVGMGRAYLSDPGWGDHAVG